MRFGRYDGGLFGGSQGATRTPASTSAAAPRLAASAIQEQSIPGVGATRANWDASHAPNPANDNGSDFGHDSSLPSYLTPNGAVYRYGERSRDWKDPVLRPEHACSRWSSGCFGSCRQELPSDSTVGMGSTVRPVLSPGFQQPDPAGRRQFMAEAATSIHSTRRNADDES